MHGQPVYIADHEIQPQATRTHVALSAMSDANGHENTQCVPLRKTTGADIPEELFERILWHTPQDLWSLDPEGDIWPSPPSNHSVVRALTSLILVCKYFARICRPRLYSEIGLRHRQHLEGLKSLLDSDCTFFENPVLAFVNFLNIYSSGEDTLWVHQVGMVILPWMKHAGLALPKVEFNVDKALAGLAPSNAPLPRTISPALSNHVSELRLDNVHFKRGQDLLHCISSLRGLYWAHINTCTCETSVSQTIFPRVQQSHVWPNISITDSCDVVPIMAANLFDYRRTSIAAVLHSPTDAQILTDIIRILYDRLVPSTCTKVCTMCMSFLLLEKTLLLIKSWLVPAVRDTGGGPRIHIGIPAGDPTIDTGNHGIVYLYLQSQGRTHYDLTMNIVKLPTLDSQPDTALVLDIWRELAGCTARLLHLDALKILFKSVELIQDFVRSVYPVLQEMRTSGRKVEIGLGEGWHKGMAIWEPLAAVLERVPYVFLAGSVLSIPDITFVAALILKLEH